MSFAKGEKKNRRRLLPEMPPNSSDVHSFFFPIEDRHSFASWVSWFSARPYLPVCGTAAYVFLVFYGPVLMSRRPAVRVRLPLILWNTGFFIYSVIGFVRGIEYMAHHLKTHDYSFPLLACDKDPDNVTAFWVAVFIVSKFFELGDTVFLILRKKPVSFLHWYHHASVLLFSWLVTMDGEPTGKFFATINLLVHSFMYAYYALQAVGGIRVPRLVSLTITGLQILQMVAGLFLLHFSYSLKSGGGCDSPTSTLAAGGLMYASFFALFVRFFVRRYISCRPTRDTIKTE